MSRSSMLLVAALLSTPTLALASGRPPSPPPQASQPSATAVAGAAASARASARQRQTQVQTQRQIARGGAGGAGGSAVATGASANVSVETGAGNGGGGYGSVPRQVPTSVNTLVVGTCVQGVGANVATPAIGLGFNFGNEDEACTRRLDAQVLIGMGRADVAERVMRQSRSVDRAYREAEEARTQRNAMRPNAEEVGGIRQIVATRPTVPDYCLTASPAERRSIPACN